MPEPTPIKKRHSIVLIGNFNPKIFHPSWFSAEGLIQKAEEEGANIEIIHSDAAIFNLDWLRVEVTEERFAVITAQEPYDPAIRDLVVGTFSILRHTPITKMGINRDMHFRIDSEEKWHAGSDKLAPKDIWKTVLEKPEMRSLTMEGDHSRDGYKGLIRVKIEPSTIPSPYGIFCDVNDHFETKDSNTTVGSDEIMDILKDTWDKSYNRSKKIIFSILDKIL